MKKFNVQKMPYEDLSPTPTYKELLTRTLHSYQKDTDPNKSAQAYIEQLLQEVLHPIVNHPHTQKEMHLKRMPKAIESTFLIVRHIYAVLQLQESYDRVLQIEDSESGVMPHTVLYSPLQVDLSLPGKASPITIGEDTTDEGKEFLEWNLIWLVDTLKKRHLSITATEIPEKPALYLQRAADFIRKNRHYTLVDADTTIDSSASQELQPLEGYVLSFFPVPNNSDAFCRIGLIHPDIHATSEDRKKGFEYSKNNSSLFMSSSIAGLDMMLLKDGKLLPSMVNTSDFKPQFFAGLGYIVPHLAKEILFKFGKLSLKTKDIPELAKILGVEYVTPEQRAPRGQNSTVGHQDTAKKTSDAYLALPRASEKARNSAVGFREEPSAPKMARSIAGHPRLLPHGFQPSSRSLLEAAQVEIELAVEILLQETGEHIRLTRGEYDTWLDTWDISEEEFEELGRVYFETFVKPHTRNIGASEYGAYRF